MSVGEIRTHEFVGNGVPLSFKYKIAADPASPSGAELHASWWSFYDEQIVRERHWQIKPGDVVLDVGSAFGSYALPALAMGAKVICFSPADFDTRLLTDNINCNPELASRCVIVRDGLHSRDGWFDPDHSVLLDRPLIDTDQHTCSQWLRVRSLDSFLAERPGIDRVDWIKLDIEGAELGALKGAEATLRKYKPRVLVECHNFHVPTMEGDVGRFMLGLDIGYTMIAHPHGAVSHAFFTTENK